MTRKSTRQSQRRVFAQRATCLGLFALCGIASAFAQSEIPAGKFNAWLYEQPVPQAPLYRARMAGVASYKSYQSKATLAFSCRADTPHVSVELTFDPKPLGFDTDPYEGPDATSSGPITVTNGDNAAVRFKVSGWYGDGGPFDTGTPFLFGFQLDDAQLKRWVADSNHGRALRVEVPSAKGTGAMTVSFRWPDDDAVFKRVVTPCLK